MVTNTNLKYALIIEILRHKNGTKILKFLNSKISKKNRIPEASNANLKQTTAKRLLFSQDTS